MSDTHQKPLKDLGGFCENSYTKKLVIFLQNVPS